MCKREEAKERNVVFGRHLKDHSNWGWKSERTLYVTHISFSSAYLLFFDSLCFKNTKAQFRKCANDNEQISISPHAPLSVSDGLIFHVLTGVKRLASDNTAISGTPSLDNYITPVLHCFHSLPVILLKSQWLESWWQRQMTAGWLPVEPSPLHVWLKVLKCIKPLSCNHGAV